MTSTAKAQRQAILIKHAKYIWEQVPEKKRRFTTAILDRHAFLVACRHKGITTLEIQYFTGFDHSTVSHATKQHENNLLIEEYELNYYCYLDKLTHIDELQEVISIENELKATLAKAKSIRERLKEFAAEKNLILKYGIS